MQAVIFSLELMKTFFNMSEPVWVYDVTFLALFGGWKGSFDFTTEHKFDRICNWLITQSPTNHQSVSHQQATLNSQLNLASSLNAHCEDSKTLRYQELDFWIKTKPISRLFYKKYTGRIDQKRQNATSLWVIYLTKV